MALVYYSPEGKKVVLSTDKGRTKIGVATTKDLGIVRPDGRTINISSTSGIISAATATTTSKGIIIPDGVTTTVDENGILSTLKPEGGIVKSDLSEDVQVSLDKAESALQTETPLPPVIDTYSDVSANTTSGKLVDALVVKELGKSVADGKASVASALTTQGVTTASDASFSTLATNVGTVATNKKAEGKTEGINSVTISSVTAGSFSSHKATVTAKASNGATGTCTVDATSEYNSGVTNGRSGYIVSPTATKSITANGNSQDVLNYKYVNVSVPNSNSATYTPTSRSSALDMGATNSYRYVNTNSVPNSNSSTYTYASGSTGGTVDMGSTNSYRYVNASNVYAKGKTDGVTAKQKQLITQTISGSFTSWTATAYGGVSWPTLTFTNMSEVVGIVNVTTNSVYVFAAINGFAADDTSGKAVTSNMQKCPLVISGNKVTIKFKTSSSNSGGTYSVTAVGWANTVI